MLVQDIVNGYRGDLSTLGKPIFYDKPYIVRDSKLRFCWGGTQEEFFSLLKTHGVDRYCPDDYAYAYSHIDIRRTEIRVLCLEADGFKHTYYFGEYKLPVNFSEPDSSMATPAFDKNNDAGSHQHC